MSSRVLVSMVEAVLLAEVAVRAVPVGRCEIVLLGPGGQRLLVEASLLETARAIKVAVLAHYGEPHRSHGRVCTLLWNRHGYDMETLWEMGVRAGERVVMHWL